MTLKRLLFLSVSVMLSLLSCNKDCESEPNLNINQAQLAKDIEAIDEFLVGYQEENNVQVESHPSGIRYLIKREGEGRRPGNCSQVRVSYEGKLITTGFVFDDGTETIRVFDLQSLITGWQIGIPLIKSGGRITLFIPSVYAYGANGRPNSGIPANANLQFEIILFEAF